MLREVHGAAQVFDVTTFGWTAALNVAALATITALGKGLLAPVLPEMASSL